MATKSSVCSLVDRKLNKTRSLRKLNQHLSLEVALLRAAAYLAVQLKLQEPQGFLAASLLLEVCCLATQRQWHQARASSVAPTPDQVSLSSQPLPHHRRMTTMERMLMSWRKVRNLHPFTQVTLQKSSSRALEPKTFSQARTQSSLR